MTALEPMSDKPDKAREPLGPSPAQPVDGLSRDGGGRPGQEYAWKPETRAEIILVFASNTEVLNVEDLLEEMDLPFELVPVPKEVNPNCGLAISFLKENRESIFEALAEGGFKPQASYLRRGDDFRPCGESDRAGEILSVPGRPPS